MRRSTNLGSLTTCRPTTARSRQTGLSSGKSSSVGNANPGAAAWSGWRGNIFTGTLIVGAIVAAMLMMRSNDRDETDLPQPADLTQSPDGLWPPKVVTQPAEQPSASTPLSAQPDSSAAGAIAHSPSSSTSSPSPTPPPTGSADTPAAYMAELPSDQASRSSSAGQVEAGFGTSFERSSADDYPNGYQSIATPGQGGNDAYSGQAAGRERSVPDFQAQQSFHAQPTVEESYRPVSVRPRVELSRSTESGHHDSHYIRPPQNYAPQGVTPQTNPYVPSSHSPQPSYRSGSTSIR